MQSTRALRLVGAQVLGPSGLQARDLVLEAGRITAHPDSPVREIDLRGLYVMPGLVDLHGDAFERQLAPRRGMVTDLGRSLFAVEADLAASGITTAWLAQFWSWEGGMRGPDFARKLAQALGDVRGDLCLDMRLQLRLERSMIDDEEQLCAFVARHAIDYVVFNDHLPYDRLDAGRTPSRLTGSAGKAGRSPEAHLAEMKRLAVRRPEIPGFVSRLASDFFTRGVVLGSHDDPTAEERSHWRAMGLRIAEFPVARAAVDEARASGDPVVMGAPNVVRGGSHTRGGMSAEALIAEGHVDALASDYHYPAMVQAVFKLVDAGVLPLVDAWALVSERPAEIMGLTDRGRIEVGRRADLVVLDAKSRRVVGAIAGGQIAMATGQFAEALLG